MKLLSIAVPCYNSAAYMDHCIRTLLHGGDEVEILIVNDGSAKDNTAEIADRYEREYPGICRAIHQENGGHGSAVCAGLAKASGVFFKVVDSDDWVDEEAYDKVLATLRGFTEQNTQLDMLVSNFVYEKEGAAHKRIMNYRRVIPKGQLISWNEIGHFLPGQYILMHSAAQRYRAGSSEAYLLCGHYFCLSAAAPGDDALLSGCKFLPLFHRPLGSVGQ